MNIRLCILLCCALMLAFPRQTQAQFWKKWFEKEEKRKPRPKSKPVQHPKDKNDATAKKKKKTLEYPASKIKSRYRIDVLIPLYLSELVKDGKPVYKDKLPEKAATGVSFYEGIKLAADTLTGLGYNIDVFVHDITEKDLSPEELIKGGVLSETDLIIGALQSHQITPIADFAKKNNVNFISAISPSDAGIKDNLFFTMLQPTLEKHIEIVEETAFKKAANQKILLLYRTNNNVDSVAASYVSEDEPTYQKISLNTTLKATSIRHFLDSTQTNILLMPVVDNGLAEKTLLQLNEWFPEYNFEVFGMPSWKYINSLKKADSYANIGVNFTSPFYYDMTTTAAQNLALCHKKQFGNRLGEMVFRGYEVLYWYAYLLHNYGNVYNTRQTDNKAAPFTKFLIKPEWNKQSDFLYNENEHLYLYRYQGGSYSVMSL